MKTTVLGAGAWGTALAKVLRENGNAVTLWDIDPVTLDELRRGRNERYLPGVALPAAVWLTNGSRFLGIVTTALGLLAIYKHKSNIQRLLNGTERHFGQKSATPEGTK